MSTLPDDSCLVAFPGFEGGLFGWVESDGVPLKVYGVQVVEGEKKAIAYIEAKVGGKFEVRTCDTRGFGEVADSFNLRLSVDGRKVSGYAIDRYDDRFSLPSTSKKRLMRFRGKRISLTEKATMSFGTLRTTDDDDAEGQASNAILSKLGSIQLAYRRVQNVDRARREAPRNAGGPSKVVVHEQSKVVSSVSHQAEYGAARLSEASGVTTYDAIDSKDSPFTQIEWRYRSRSILELEGFVDPLPVFTLGSDATLVGSPMQDKSVDGGDIPVHSPRTQRFLELKEEMDRLYAVKAHLEGAPKKRQKTKTFDEIEREKEENRQAGTCPEVIDLCDSDSD